MVCMQVLKVIYALCVMFLRVIYFIVLLLLNGFVIVISVTVTKKLRLEIKLSTT